MAKVFLNVAKFSGQFLRRELSTVCCNRTSAHRFVMNAAFPKTGRNSIECLVLPRTSISYRLNSTAAKLSEFLKEEIEAEKDTARKQLKGGGTPQMSGYDVKYDDAEIILSKTYGSEKVTIRSNINHSVGQLESHATIENASQSQDDAPVMVAKPNFMVEIEKKKQNLVFECSFVDYNAEEVEQQSDGDLFSIDEVYMHQGEITEKCYAVSGDIMDGTLYDHLMDYLAERGIDNKFAQQLSDFATHYEHAQYVALLQKIRDFAGKN